MWNQPELFLFEDFHVGVLALSCRRSPIPPDALFLGVGDDPRGIKGIPDCPDELWGQVKHWGVENSLHWRLDVVVNKDQDRTRMGHGPENLAVLRQMAINAMQKEGSKGSLRGKFKRAGWYDQFLHLLLVML